MMTTYRLTSAQRCVLADCVRLGLVGWLITDPQVSHKARAIQGRATNILGFGFSRFATMAATHFGSDYHAKSVVAGDEFPLSIVEAVALANDIELEMATDDQLFAAAQLAAHSPFAQPEVGSRDWRSYTTMLDRLGIDMMDGDPTWKAQVAQRLHEFRRLLVAPVAAE